MNDLQTLLSRLTETQLQTWEIVSRWWNAIDWENTKGKDVHTTIETGIRSAGYAATILEAERLFCRKMAIESTVAYLEKDNATHVMITTLPLAQQREILQSIREETSLYMSLLAIQSGLRKEAKKEKKQTEKRDEEEALFEEKQRKHNDTLLGLFD